MRLLSFAAGLLAIAAVASADDKKGGRTPEAKGTFAFDGKTYKVAGALAYATTVGDMKRTVVILCEKSLDAAQLKQSLKKYGDARDLIIYASTIEFAFDDKGTFRELAILTHDGGMKHVSADEVKDHKATVTITDAAAKGKLTVAKENRETLTKHTYRFDVTFDLLVTRP